MPFLELGFDRRARAHQDYLEAPKFDGLQSPFNVRGGPEIPRGRVEGDFHPCGQAFGSSPEADLSFFCLGATASLPS